MKAENAPDLKEGLRVRMCGMICRDYELRLRAVYVRALIRYDSVRAVRRISSAAVSDDRVERYRGGDRCFRQPLKRRALL